MGVISKLEAVNHMLLMAGESLVPDLSSSGGIDTEISLFLLDQLITDTQLRGLANNRYVKKYNLEADGNIVLPQDTIAGELVSTHLNDDNISIKGISRNNEASNEVLLVNITDNSSTWKKETDYYVEIIYQLDWEEIDTPTQRTIMASAARQYQLVMQGDGDIDAYLGAVEQMFKYTSRGHDIDDYKASVYSSLSSKTKQAIGNRRSNNDTSKYRFWRTTNG
jgi:hypothetical protein